MEIKEAHNGKTQVYQLFGRLDSKTSLDFEKRLMAAIENGSKWAVINCEQLDYISSAGLRVLNKGAKKLRPAGGKIVLCQMRDYVREVFEIAGFDSFLPIVDTMEQALAKTGT